MLHSEVVPSHLLQQLLCYLWRSSIRPRSEFGREPLKLLGCEGRLFLLLLLFFSPEYGRGEDFLNCSFGTRPFVAW